MSKCQNVKNRKYLADQEPTKHFHIIPLFPQPQVVETYRIRNGKKEVLNICEYNYPQIK